MSIKRDILWRVYLAMLFVVVLGGGILFKTFQIQHVEGSHWRALADSLTTAYLPIDAERGNIFASDGSLLATSLPFFDIRFDARTEAITQVFFNEKVDSLAHMLSLHFKDKTKQQYKQQLINARNSGKRYTLIKSNITYHDLQAVKTFAIFNKGRFRGGLIVIQKSKRVHPFQMLASRTIGFQRNDKIAVGLEGKYNEALAGVQGKRLMQKIAGGTWVPVNDNEEFSSVHGNDIVTTIDIELQDVLEHALLSALDSHQAHHGCAVLMEVATGKIKAIANLGRDKNGKYSEDYNYAVGEATEPGSTFKLMSVLALIEDGYINKNTTVDIEKGVRKFYDRTMRDSEWHDMTTVTVKKAFAKSSNVAFAKLIDEYYRHQPQKFLDHIEKVGLSKVVSFEIAGEPEPFIKKREDKSWSGVTLPWMAVGYELKLTPLQMLTFYNAIANNGKSVKPYVVEKILQNGVVVESFKTEVLNEKICSDETLAQLRDMLQAVVDSGTARNVYDKEIRIAGKTGTAKLLDKTLGYKHTFYQASFCGYFPSNNPKYSCVVVITSPSTGLYYGSKVAAPVFKEVAEKIYSTSFDIHQPVNTEPKLFAENYRAISKSYRDDLVILQKKLSLPIKANEADADWVQCERSENYIKVQSVNYLETLVPDVTGMGLRDALYLLETLGLRVQVSGSGMVKRQSLLPGERIEKGKQIIIELS